MKKVRDFMSAKPITIKPDSTIEEAVRKMVLAGVTGMPVTDKEGKLLGMFSITDVLSKAYPSFNNYYENPESYNDFSELEQKVPDLKTNMVKDFMTTNVFTVTPDTPLMKAFSTRLAKRVGRLPVVEGGYVVGVIDTSDIFHGVIVNSLDLSIDLKDLYSKRTKRVKHNLNGKAKEN